MERKIVVITGGSSGIGRATARRFAAAGAVVYDLSRREAKDPEIRHIPSDVTNAGLLQAAAAQVLAEAGGIDLLICCAGMGISGPVETVPEADALRQFDVNLMGTIRTVQAFLPAMRKAKHGRIICVSSVAAVYAIPFQAHYSASKAAINAFADALGNETRPFGISVCAVMPGDIATGFTNARKKTFAGEDVYLSANSAVEKMEKDEQNGMPPDAVAKKICKIAEKKTVSPLYTVGASYQTLVFLRRLFPAAVASKIVGGMYQ